MISQPGISAPELKHDDMLVTQYLQQLRLCNTASIMTNVSVMCNMVLGVY